MIRAKIEDIEALNHDCILFHHVLLHFDERAAIDALKMASKMIIKRGVIVVKESLVADDMLVTFR